MSTPYDPKNTGGKIVTSGTIPQGTLAQSDLSRVLPRQISTGNYRGTQTITGQLIVADPVTNNPVITISGTEQNQIFTDPSTQVPQIIIGKLDDGSYGMKVAPLGTNVLTADDEDLYFTSSQNNLRIRNIVTGTYMVTPTDASNSYANFSFAHGLTFAPTVTGSFSNTSDGLRRQLPYLYQAPLSNYFGLETASATVSIFSIDNTNINISVKILDILGTSWFLTNSILSFKFICQQESIVAA